MMWMIVLKGLRVGIRQAVDSNRREAIQFGAVGRGEEKLSEEGFKWLPRDN